MRAFCTWRVVEIRFRQYDNFTEYGSLVNSGALDDQVGDNRYHVSQTLTAKDSRVAEASMTEELISVQRLKYLVFLRR